MMKTKLLFLAATHGNEEFTIPLLEKLEKKFSFDWKVANPKALAKKIRFTESDLNRSGPGNTKSNLYEERRAKKIIALGNKYKTIIDLHGTISNSGIFVIVTNPSWENIELAKKLNIKNVVLWPGLLPTGPLTQFIPNSLEIECGPKSEIETSKKLERILKEYLSGNLTKTKQTFYIVNGIFTKNTKKELKDFKKFRYKNITFYPLMVGQYPKMKCYMMQKLGDIL